MPGVTRGASGHLFALRVGPPGDVEEGAAPFARLGEEVAPGDPPRRRRVVGDAGPVDVAAERGQRHLGDDRQVEVGEEAVVEGQPGDRAECRLGDREGHLAPARIAPAGDLAAADPDDAVGRAAVEQRAHHVGPGLARQRRRQPGVHVAGEVGLVEAEIRCGRRASSAVRSASPARPAPSALVSTFVSIFVQCSIQRDRGPPLSPTSPS